MEEISFCKKKEKKNTLVSNCLDDLIYITSHFVKLKQPLAYNEYKLQTVSVLQTDFAEN